MKKIYLLGISALLVGSSFAQNAKKKMTPGAAPLKATASTSKLVNTTPNHTQAVHWTDDFSNPANWTITEGAGSSGSALWVIGTTPASGTYSGSYGEILSTSAANGYALFDSDSDCSGDQIAELTTTNSIDLTGFNNIRLVFEEHYLRWYDSTLVYVSNDGGTAWTPFPLAINNNTDIEGGPTTIGPNPTTVTVDISSVAGNQSNVKIRFTFYSTQAEFGAAGGCGYMWYIDDARIEDIPSIDASITDMTLVDDACGLSNAETVAIDIMNGGMAPITGFNVSYIVNGGTPVVETYTATIAAGATATYTFTTTVDMSAPMAYTIDANVTLTGDGDASNDNMTGATEHYPLVNAPYTTSFEGTPVSDLENWTIYNVDGTFNGWSLDNTYPNSGTNELIVVEFDAAQTTPVAGLSDQWAISSCLNLSTGVTYRVKYFTRTFPSFEGGIEVAIGSTKSVAGMTTTIKPHVASPSAGYAADSTDFTVASSGVYYMGFRAQNTNASANTAVLLDDISITVAPPIGIKENAANNTIAIFPNPSNGVFTVKAVENSSVEVYSVIGENVYAANLVKGNNSVDLSNMAAGTYIVKVKSGNETTTKRVVINK